MGNICEGTPPLNSQLVIIDGPKRPKVSDQIQRYLETHKAQLDHFQVSKSVIKQRNRDIFEGGVTSEVYQEKGRLYKSNGSVFIGTFQDGQCRNGHYIFPDGSSLIGDVKNLIKGDIFYGVFRNLDGYEYKGNFMNNQFHGEGQQITKDYRFKGEFKNGKRVRGILTWGQSKNYEYEGAFDDSNLFTGESKLKQPTGVYNGPFSNGKKHGQGVYRFKNGLVYKGQYKNGLKEGKGKLLNEDQTISYQGQFANGLPQGKGVAYSEKGRKVLTDFIEGIPYVYYNQLKRKNNPS